MNDISQIDESARLKNRRRHGPWFGPGPEPIYLYLPRGWPKTSENTQPAPREWAQAVEIERRRAGKVRVPLGARLIDRPPGRR